MIKRPGAGSLAIVITHVVVLQAETPVPGTSAPFELMVDDVDATHRDYAQKGLTPAPRSLRQG